MEYTPIGFDKECSEIRLYYKKNEDGTFDVDIPNFIVLDDNEVEHGTILKFSNVVLDGVYDNEGVMVYPNKHISTLVDLIKDLKNILKDNREHHLEINISWDGVRVYLQYDPNGDFDESCVIPIYYTTVEDFAYIPNDEYRKKYNPSDYGIDANEVKLISEIMDYLELHGDEIDELCSGLDFQDRECYNEG